MKAMAQWLIPACVSDEVKDRETSIPVEVRTAACSDLNLNRLH
jgi:hypothetical protein